MRTFVATAQDAGTKWHVIDANDQVLGRVATVAARLLQGKHKASYTPFIDTGDHVVVINADKIKLTCLKSESKVYRHYTGYPGGLRQEEFTKRFARKPELIVQEAIEGMLPKSKMGRAMAKKLKVYKGDRHPHQAQKPEALSLAKRA